MIGQRIAHFEIVALLGRGGMGEVYRAQDTRLDREVAIKVLSAELTDDPDRLERFGREARLLAAVKHPNVVTIHSVEESDGRHSIVMELVEGPTLETVIPDEGLPLERLLELAIPLTDALAAAHQAGITHRDLKPGNVMIDADGRLKVLDFGLAKGLPGLGGDGSDSAAATQAATQAGRILGTVAYMSPEQAEGKPVDARSDLFSLGVVLYEMATGGPPFGGDTPLSTLLSILRDSPPPVTAVRSGLPSRFDAIVERCLEKDPEQRVQTAAEVRDELAGLADAVQRGGAEPRRAGSDTGVQGTAAPAAGPPANRARRRLAVAVGAALVALLGLAVYRNWQPASVPVEVAGPQALDESALAVLPFTVRGSSEVDYLGEGIVDLLSTKLDGGELRSVDPNAVLAYVSQELEGPVDRAGAERVARNFNASLSIAGDIVEAGGRLHISAALYRAGQEAPVSRASVEGPAEDIFALVDDLAAELMTEQVSGAGSEFTRTAALTTNSLPALKAFLEAAADLRAGRFSAAFEALERTVELDPEFALAWYRLGVAAEWAARSDVIEEVTEKALALSEGLPDRHRRLLEARLVARRGDAERAESLYRGILASYPNEVEAWVQLAEVLSHHAHTTGRSSVGSRAAWERVLELEPDRAGALWHLVRVAALEGQAEEVDRMVARIRELNPEAERWLEMRAIREYFFDNEEGQAEVLAGLAEAPNTVVNLAGWNMAVATDIFEGGASIMKLLTAPERSAEARGQGHAVGAYAAVAQGRWREARESLVASAEFAPATALEHRGLLSLYAFLPVTRAELGRLRSELEAWDAAAVPPAATRTFYFTAHDELHEAIRLYLLGRVSARLGDDAAAAVRAEELETLAGPEGSARVVANLALSVQAQRRLAAGDKAGALELLERRATDTASYQEIFASPFISQGYERLVRAELLHELGRSEEAIPWLSIMGEISMFDEALVAMSQFRLGEIYETLGQPGNAARHYASFVEMWKSADPELEVWVETAQQRLAAL